jgi:hypothetical protein
MSANYAIFAFQLVAFIILVALMHDLYRKLRRDESRPASGPDAVQMRAGVDEMVAELRRAADRINADILARAGTLQKLVDEADQKLRALDAAVARADAGRLPAPRPARPAPRPAAASIAPRAPESPPLAAEPPARPAEPALARAAAPPSPMPAPRRAPDPARPAPASAALSEERWPGAPASEPTRTMPRVAPAAGAAGSAYRQAARATAAPSGAAPSAGQAAELGDEQRRTRADEFVELGLDDAGKFQTVRRLADQGLSAAEIARQTRLGREEVELIMQLSGEARS